MNYSTTLISLIS